MATPKSGSAAGSLESSGEHPAVQSSPCARYRLPARTQEKGSGMRATTGWDELRRASISALPEAHLRAGFAQSVMHAGGLRPVTRLRSFDDLANAPVLPAA